MTRLKEIRAALKGLWCAVFGHRWIMTGSYARTYTQFKDSLEVESTIIKSWDEYFCKRCGEEKDVERPLENENEIIEFKPQPYKIA